MIFYLKDGNIFKIDKKIISIDNDNTAWYIETEYSLITVYIKDIFYVIYNRSQD